MNKLRFFVGIFAAIILAIAGIFFLGKSVKPKAAKIIKAHYYKDANIDISKIKLKVFYVVAKNQTIAASWSEQIASALKDVTDLHTVQFHIASQISSDVYPSPVFLKHEATYYDTDNTN